MNSLTVLQKAERGKNKMFAIIKRELKLGFKSLLIWALTVGGLGLICTLMYTSMDGDMQDMAEQFSNMGAFADAFGMSTLSIATLKGFFATEVGTVHGLGSAMFAAFLASCMLSKEEDGHTGEFLYSLPVARWKVVTAKALTLLVSLVIFTVVCELFYVAGFAMLDEEIPWEMMNRFMGSMLLMNIEIAAISFFTSAISSRNRGGVALGLSLIVYAYDIMGRAVPDLKEYLFIGPFSFANASEIFADIAAPDYSILIGCVVTVIAVAASYITYLRRDLNV